MTDKNYNETRVGERLNVGWTAAVITYAAKVAAYGWMFGASVATLAVLSVALPGSGSAWLRALLMIVTGGGVFAGLFGGAAIIVKDYIYPYTQPYEHIRTLPTMAAPEEMKPRPLMRVDGSTFRYGKLKLEPAQLLALAQAIVANGESTISQRKLAEWGIVPSKDSDQAKQLKADIEYLEYGTASGNGLLQVTAAFRDYLAGLFPAIPPTPAVNLVAANGVDRHHHQTPPGLHQ